jgi:hypothetical protein
MKRAPAILIALLFCLISEKSLGVSRWKEPLEYQRTDEYQKTLDLQKEILGISKLPKEKKITGDQVASLRRLGLDEQKIKSLAGVERDSIDAIIKAQEEEVLQKSSDDLKKLEDSGYTKEVAESIILRKPEAKGVTVEQALAIKKPVTKTTAVEKSGVVSIFQRFIQAIGLGKKTETIQVAPIKPVVPVKPLDETEVIKAQQDAQVVKTERALATATLAQNMQKDAEVREKPGDMLKALAQRLAALNSIDPGTIEIIRAREEKVKKELEEKVQEIAKGRSIHEIPETELRPAFSDDPVQAKKMVQALREAEQLLELVPKTKDDFRKMQLDAKKAYEEQLRTTQGMLKAKGKQKRAELKTAISDAKKIAKGEKKL